MINDDAFASSQEGVVGSGLINILQREGFDGVIAKQTVKDSFDRCFDIVTWGLLPGTGLQKIRYANIEANHFEWPTLTKVDDITPEFFALYKAKTTPTEKAAKPKTSITEPGM